MTLVTALQEEVVTKNATMTVVVEATVDVIMTVDMVEDDATIVIVATAETVTIMPLATSTVTPVTIDTVAVAMTDVEAAEDTLIVMSVANVAPPVMPLHQPPMVIQLLVASPGNHTEVEASMKIDFPVVNIDC
jgi:hypothetical protein